MVAFAPEAIVVSIGTLLLIPVWILPCVLGGLIGVAVGKKVRRISGVLAMRQFLVWILAPACSFIFSFLLTITL